MNKKLIEQINDIKVWAFPVAGMAFIGFVPIAGFLFSLTGLIQSWILYRRFPSENKNLIIFCIIGTIISLFVTIGSIVLTYQEFVSSSLESSSLSMLQLLF